MIRFPKRRILVGMRVGNLRGVGDVSIVSVTTKGKLSVTHGSNEIHRPVHILVKHVISQSFTRKQTLHHMQ